MKDLKKVYQTKYSLKDGNCFEACVSTLTTIPLHVIPSFGDNENWIKEFFNWMKGNGYNVIRINNPLNGNFQTSKPMYVLGRNSIHAFILNCYTIFKNDTMQTHFELYHDPLKDNVVDINSLLSIFIIEKEF